MCKESIALHKVEIISSKHDDVSFQQEGNERIHVMEVSSCVKIKQNC